MNRYEFMACGFMLYGNAWKTDLAESLGFSPKSNGIAKITKGERGITEGVAKDVILKLEQKAQQLLEAAEALKNPKKCLILKSAYNVITFDAEGVRQWDGFQGFPISSISVILHDAELSVHESEITLISLAIAAAGAEALRTGSNKDLIELIAEYFDLQHFNKTDIEKYRIG